MRRKFIYVLLTVLALAFAAMGEAAETAPTSGDVSESSELIEIEYGES